MNVSKCAQSLPSAHFPLPTVSAPQPGSLNDSNFNVESCEMDDCPICLCPLENDSELRTLQCSHKFHRHCIVRHKLHGVSKTCPMCRAVLPDPSTQFKQGMELFGELLVKVEKGETSWTALTLEEELRAKIMVSCLQGSADHGIEHAMMILGWVTFSGSGVDANTELGISWLQEAANMGNANSCAALGCIARDSGNHKESLYWFKLAADQGNCEAQFSLGCASCTGKRAFVC